MNDLAQWARNLSERDLSYETQAHTLCQWSPEEQCALLTEQSRRIMGEAMTPQELVGKTVSFKSYGKTYIVDVTAIYQCVENPGHIVVTGYRIYAQDGHMSDRERSYITHADSIAIL